jgi:alpha-glucosidase
VHHYLTGGADHGGLPWTCLEPPFGFSPPGAAVQQWLPQPKEWRLVKTT